MSSRPTVAPANLGARIPVAGGSIGVGALALTYLLGRDEPARWLAPYLIAYLFFTSLAVGALFVVLMHHITRAGWSTTSRRLAEHIAATTPYLALLFLPIAFSLETLYPWAEIGATHTDPTAKEIFLSPGPFRLRAAIYLFVWSAMAFWFRRRSIQEDNVLDPSRARRTRAVAAPALLLYGVTVTLASFDWILSLDPHWYSTIFGVYFFAGSVAAAYALLLLAIRWLESRGQMIDLVTVDQRRDLGKLLFGFVVLWAYLGFSQYLLIWYGNLPEETVWFAHRLTGHWQWITRSLVVAHFVVPFLFLLPQSTKRSRKAVGLAAAWVLAAHYLDLYWLIAPESTLETGSFWWFGPLTFAGIGGSFLALLAYLANGRAIVPSGDPRFRESRGANAH